MPGMGRPVKAGMPQRQLVALYQQVQHRLRHVHHFRADAVTGEQGDVQRLSHSASLSAAGRYLHAAIQAVWAVAAMRARDASLFVWR